MAAREILQLGNPLLWRRCDPVIEFDSSSLHELIRDLSETLAAFRDRTGYGRGIAAPQIGFSTRVIFLRMPGDGFAAALVNPKIVRYSEERFELWDDCFSFPDLMVRVSRSYSVRVEYHDERGASRAIEAEGSLSELLQHEIDHIDGILAVDRAGSPRAFATRSQWESGLP